MNVKKDLITKNTKRRSGQKISKVEFFVDHDTGNPNSTARNNVDYYKRSANDMSASAHAFVDDKEVIICVPCLQEPEKAWHVRYNVPNDNKIFGCNANDSAIGIEMCYFPDDKKRTEKAYNNYIEFAVQLAKHHNVNPTKRVGHFELDPSRRSDPNNALRYINKTYEDMKKDIINKYNEKYNKKGMKVKMEEKIFKGFNDVPNWAKKDVLQAKERGIVRGDANGNINANLDSIKAIVMINRAINYMMKGVN